MRLSYIQGLGDTVTFHLSTGESHTLPKKSYTDVSVQGSVTVSVDGAGSAEFTNADECCCTREYNAPQAYLQRIEAGGGSNKLVNAWIYLAEDEPGGTNYNAPTSCYQSLISDNVYQAVDVLFLCFVDTIKTGSQTVPTGDGSSCTLEIGNQAHPGNLTNQDYMNFVIRDARKNNPGIKICVTLAWGDDAELTRIFANASHSPEQNAAAFAANLMAYLKHYDLDGFDIDWESPLSSSITKEQFKLLLDAIGAQFKQQDKRYFLTLSPAEVGNLDATAVNANVAFVNLQLYSGFTYPEEFTKAGINKDLFAYGAKFESDYQTAEGAYNNNNESYHYPIFTCWRLNSTNYKFEQAQQKQLFQLVFKTT